MWYKKIPAKTVVWVANREIPLTNKSGVLKVIEPGLLVLLNDTNGRKLGWNFITGLEVYPSSWKSNKDPISGDFTYHCDPTGYPQTGSVELYRTGPWNGLRFSGIPNLTVHLHCPVLSSVCNIGNSPVCGCLNRFLPKDPETWKNGDWSNSERMLVEDCKVECLNNCNCTAYTYLDISRGGSGCLLWFGDLFDMKELLGTGQYIYIRMAYSRLARSEYDSVKKSNQRLKGGGLGHNFADNHNDESHNKDIELPLSDLHTITKATDNL
ncbi:G-type lectin S-receptor-like serine/threonine-protein kinase At4g27290 [Olea europaea var. sylvestris]|uniref:G-type lectin S-receptor-like serine/threonine-protein kinase At4g27290 n=1 Tax=Olea europaea var. sylvestris TaxID=158386 RepID=UPI000C1CD355|nr:G-type lectin S-receptor-like serine/threonine-protein kinase At4g27290 [Olea europaea var. sylvestris]